MSILIILHHTFTDEGTFRGRTVQHLLSGRHIQPVQENDGSYGHGQPKCWQSDAVHPPGPKFLGTDPRARGHVQANEPAMGQFGYLFSHAEMEMKALEQQMQAMMAADYQAGQQQYQMQMAHMQQMQWEQAQHQMAMREQMMNKEFQ